MSDSDRDNILAGLYRRSGELAEAIGRLTRALATSQEAVPSDDIRVALFRTTEALEQVYKHADMTDALRKDLGEIIHAADTVLNATRKRKTQPVRDALAPTLPGLPDEDWTPPSLTPPPREWGNTVRVYDWLWTHTHGGRFDLAEMFAHRDEIAEATRGKIGVATYQRVLSALVAAGAANRTREGYAVKEPTDELRSAVEAARANRKEGAR